MIRKDGTRRVKTADECLTEIFTTRMMDSVAIRELRESRRVTDPVLKALCRNKRAAEWSTAAIEDAVQAANP